MGIKDSCPHSRKSIEVQCYSSSHPRKTSNRMWTDKVMEFCKIQTNIKNHVYLWSTSLIQMFVQAVLEHVICVKLVKK